VFVISIGFAAVLLSVVFANVMLLVPKRAVSREKWDRSYWVMSSALSFGMCFVIVGTFTGGLWASVAWGRFWGWDPKENAALMLILWCALALHARRSALVTEIGFVRLVALAGLVLYWSWAGTNILGAGLHNYHKFDFGFMTLHVYAVFQVLVVLVSIARFRKREVMR